MGWELPKLQFPARKLQLLQFPALGPLMGWICLQALLLQLLRSSQGRFCFLPENDFLGFVVQKNVEKKLRLRGLDLSGEIRAEILHITPPWV